MGTERTRPGSRRLDFLAAVDGDHHAAHTKRRNKSDRNRSDHEKPDNSFDGDTLIVAHGAVGSLVLCHLLGTAITRAEDQNGGAAAAGGGNYWSYDDTHHVVQHRWRAIEAPT